MLTLSIKGTVIKPTGTDAIDRTPSSLLGITLNKLKVGKKYHSGKISSGAFVLNSARGKKERIGRMLQMHSNKRDEISEARAGDICAVIGLKEAITGETLCDEKNKITLESMNFPEPVISVAVEPKTKEDQENLINS